MSKSHSADNNKDKGSKKDKAEREKEEQTL